MYHYHINGNYKIIKDNHKINCNKQIVEGMASETIIDQDVNKILDESRKDIMSTIDKHKEDLLKNINVKNENIGLGDDDPSHKLTVKSEKDNFRLIGTDLIGPSIVFTNNIDNSGYISYGGPESTIGEGSIGFATSNTKKEDDIKMTIKNKGDVGIGTNPLYKMHISSGENKKTELGISKSYEWGNAKIKYQPADVNYMSLGFSKGVNKLTDNNIEDGISVTRVGKVGIKTSEPKTDLHLKNDFNTDTYIGISSKEKKAGIVFDTSGTHDFAGEDTSQIYLDKKNMYISNSSRNENITLMTNNEDRLIVEKDGEVKINQKLSTNSKIFKLEAGDWKNGGMYSWSHNLGFVPSFVKAYIEFTETLGGIFKKDTFYEITNANDTTEWPYQRGVYITYDAEKVYIRIAPYGPMLLNITGKAKSYSDIKSEDGNIIVKVFNIS